VKAIVSGTVYDPASMSVVVVPFEVAAQPARSRLDRFWPALREWMMRTGKRIDLDQLAVILDARGEWQRDEASGLWTKEIVYHVLRCDVFNWCSMRRVLIPEGIPETLDRYLEFLDSEDLMDKRSDPLSRLRLPLRCYGGVGPPLKRCRCFDP
jgi:hypothetical protein